MQKDQELLLIIKTQDSLLPRLTEAVKSKHPYDLCEVISLPITGGSDAYLDWLRKSTG